MKACIETSSAAATVKKTLPLSSLHSSPLHTMAARQLGRRAAVPALLVAGTILTPRTTLHAESPSEPHQVLRRPIYDDEVPIRNTAPLPSRPEAAHPIATQEKGLTSDLAGYVRKARLFTAAHVGLVEERVNAGAQRFFDAEASVTSTVAGLAPDPRTGEKVLPGALYVVVAGMAGQIVTRRRNILLRASAPLLFAVGAANYLLPHTSANVAALLWSWEQRFPVVAENHLRARAAVAKSVEDAKKATADARLKLDDAVRRGRETIESYVKKGQ